VLQFFEYYRKDPIVDGQPSIGLASHFKPH
jgi:hypothetical protein